MKHPHDHGATPPSELDEARADAPAARIAAMNTATRLAAAQGADSLAQMDAAIEAAARADAQPVAYRAKLAPQDAQARRAESGGLQHAYAEDAKLLRYLGPVEPLYAAPAPRQPLSEQRIEEAFRDGYCARETYNDKDVSDIDKQWQKAKAYLLRGITEDICPKT